MLVEATGPRALLVGLGTPGRAGLGFATGGAADRQALIRANRIVGNPEGAVGIEAVLGGCVLRAERACVVAVTGAGGPLDVDGQPRRPEVQIPLAPGQRLRVGMAERGLRWYVGVRGGFDVELASGPPPSLKAGDVVPVGVDAVVPPTLAITRGPRFDWFTDAAHRELASAVWSVSPASDRVGIRLTGSTLERLRAGELPSEGLIPGAVQVPSGGEPLVFGPDHPVTGGYPVVAVVSERDLDWLAQLRPGETLRLAWQD